MNNEKIIAYFDILGYKELIERSKLEDVRDKMYGLLDKVNNLTNNPNIDVYSKNDLDYIIFSDSIIIYSNDISIKSFLNICFTSNVLMYFSFLEGLPLRGAISHGEFYVDKDKNIFFGKALVNAYMTEGKQKWSGACICEETINYFLDNNSKIMNTLIEKTQSLIKYDIPIGFKHKEINEFKCNKNGNLVEFNNIDVDVMSSYVLNWVMIENFLKDIDKSRVINSDEELIELFLLSDFYNLEQKSELEKIEQRDVFLNKDLSVQFKIINTINFYHYSKDRIPSYLSNLSEVTATKLNEISNKKLKDQK